MEREAYAAMATRSRRHRVVAHMLCAGALVGCGEYPRDAEDSTRRARTSAMRVGVSHDPPHVVLAPVIGTVDLGGRVVWMGWLMMAALGLSAVPAVLLGRAKLRLARRLSLKPLHTDADTSKADWMTALAGIVGVAGIGFGVWWADAAAALFIAASVLHDGVGSLRGAVRDLHDARPQELDRSDPDPITRQVHDAVTALPWVATCRVRMHAEGFRICGVVFVRTTDGAIDVVRLRAAHWRIDEIVVTAGGRGA